MTLANYTRFIVQYFATQTGMGRNRNSTDAHCLVELRYRN